MIASILAERLGRYLQLDVVELAALASLGEVERTLTRGQVLRRENDTARELFVVRRGWLYSSLLLPDGNRQILSLHLRGDFAGDTALHYTTAPFTLTAASDAIVSTIDKVMLGRMCTQHPRLATLILALAQAERVALADRLASVGRTTALSRVAALIVDIYRRLRAVGEPTAGGFVLPLTQEEIGDATGLTAVHVNRMMRQLVEDQLISRRNSHVTVIDEAGLSRLGHHTDRLAAIDIAWLPGARVG